MVVVSRSRNNKNWLRGSNPVYVVHFILLVLFIIMAMMLWTTSPTTTTTTIPDHRQPLVHSRSANNKPTIRSNTKNDEMIRSMDFKQGQQQQQRVSIRSTTPKNQSIVSTTPDSQQHSKQQLQVTVIVIGYNRLDGMQRLLASLEQTIIPASLRIHLHICLDGGADDAVYNYATNYTESNDNKFHVYTVFRRPHNYGLAQHIAACWEKPEPDEWALFLEDDVVVTPRIFQTFSDATVKLLRTNHNTQIQGIAMHGQRVNQYCWKKMVQRQHCPSIAKQCLTTNATDSSLGALMCLDNNENEHNNDWITTQIPSSWGAFYTAKAWKTFQDYFHEWQKLTLAQTATTISLPYSMSNEWTKSWKRPMAELLYLKGWTILYRNRPQQASMAITTRNAGVHTKKNATKYEQMSKCLLELPRDDDNDDDTTTTAAAATISSIPHYDYCSYRLENLQLLQQRGAAVVQRLNQLYKAGADQHHPLQPIVQILLREDDDDEDEKATTTTTETSTTQQLIIPAHGTVARFAAQIILVASAYTVNRELKHFLSHLPPDGSRVHMLLTGPSPVCVGLRGYESVTCLDETDFVNEKTGMPIITKLLRAGLDAAIPGVTKFVGFLNSDVVFGKGQLEKTVDTILLSNKNNETNICTTEHCVLVGQRVDVDWKNESNQKLHSVYGMDYFLFSTSGAQYAVDTMPPLVVGRVRWDSYFMGKFVLSDNIDVIDVTSVLTTYHRMDFSQAFASKKHDDLTNHYLAKEEYRFGRTDYANYKISVNDGTKKTTIIPHRSTQELQKDYRHIQERYQFDLFIETSTDFVYSPAAIYPFIQCWCALLLPQQQQQQQQTASTTTSTTLEEETKKYCSSKSLLAHEIEKMPDKKSRPMQVIPYDLLSTFQFTPNPQLFESLQFSENIINGEHDGKCCYTKDEGLDDQAKQTRPRRALLPWKIGSPICIV